MTPVSKKLDDFYFRYFPTLVMLIFFSVVFARLSMMQTEGLLAFGGIFVTSLFAVSSLLYARATVVKDPAQIAKRAEIADESFKAAFLAVLGLGVTAFSFMVLSDSYCVRVGHPLDRNGQGAELVPMLASLACFIVFVVPTFAKVQLVMKKTIEDM